MPSLAQRAFTEMLGTAFLLAAVVGSGIMAARLAGGNGALALLCNTLPTGAILTVLILTFGPISGAHFNPAVSIAFALKRELLAVAAAVYIAAQVLGAIAGVWAAHLMFELPLWQLAGTVRTGPGQWLAESIATFGLLLTIFGCLARTPAATAYAVGLYITAAYWFTASTSFANPAVTLARALSDTFAGIAPGGVSAFIGAQLMGMVAAVIVGRWLWPHPEPLCAAGSSGIQSDCARVPSRASETLRSPVAPSQVIERTTERSRATLGAHLARSAVGLGYAVGMPGGRRLRLGREGAATAREQRGVVVHSDGDCSHYDHGTKHKSNYDRVAPIAGATWIEVGPVSGSGAVAEAALAVHNLPSGSSCVTGKDNALTPWLVQ